MFKKVCLPLRRRQDRSAPRRRRACQNGFRHFITISNPQRLRSARAVWEAWFNRAFQGHAFLRRSLRDRSCHPLPRTSPAAPDCRRSGRAPEKLMTPGTPKQHGRRESAAGSTPHRSGCRPSSGALCAGKEGLSGDRAPISIPLSPVFHKTFNNIK